MTIIVLLIVLLYSCVVTGESVPNVRSGNPGNCIGTKSCRPRCISFSLDWTVVYDDQCFSTDGIFSPNNQTSAVAWDLSRSGVSKCLQCSQNDTCGWSSDLTVRVTEQGSHWAMGTDILLRPPEDNRFTFCSIYPCPRIECALPEQMGSILGFDVFTAHESPNKLLLSMQLALTSEFEGEIFTSSLANRIGPLQVTWMDDPTSCRIDLFPMTPPVPPNVDPLVRIIAMDNPIESTAALFCSGSEYDPRPLNGTLTSPTVPSSTTLDFWFHDRHELYTQKALKAWASLTLTYIRLQGFTVENITSVEQSLSTSAPNMHVEVVSADKNSRRGIMESQKQVHKVRATVIGYNIDIDVKTFFNNTWDAYVRFLETGMSRAMQQSQESPKPEQSGPNVWQLAALIVGTALVGFAVAITAHDKFRTVHEQPQPVADHSRAESSVVISEESDTGWSIPDYRNGSDRSPDRS